ncbi:CPLD51 protein required for cyt b6 assembly [Dunaliella salina]|uniref:CPLD51 protein required for cyt b6 assembly n=1 Tax=Dunaliella salina TaxID=3046 RepID=A0ABQ7GTQ2_DUNSA|nr:CPLD51 protein required for cyt b6 assembly [Dunaliella salina]|eukprot:KAF5837984.1 CPLD51 protein required for cyt b6 assembly [Dunaliella salina]
MNTSMMLRSHGKQACSLTRIGHPHPFSLKLKQPVQTAIACAQSKCSQPSGVQGGGNSVAPHEEPTTAATLHPNTAVQQPEVAQDYETASAISHSTFLASFTLFLLTNAPEASAQAFEPVNPFTGVYAPGQYVTFALFLMTVPGIWSQIKRAPKASKKRKVYEVDGPAKENAIPLKERARQIVSYFKKYNYETKEMGEVITFVGTYGASKGQAAALTFYTFVGMASVALVMSLVVPQIGNWWYALTLLAPGAWFYYFSRGTRQEEVKVKMATADDELTTDIIIEGDPEEIDRFRKELNLMEKGMVPVKGLLE